MPDHPCMAVAAYSSTRAHAPRCDHAVNAPCKALASCLHVPCLPLPPSPHIPSCLEATHQEYLQQTIPSTCLHLSGTDARTGSIGGIGVPCGQRRARPRTYAADLAALVGFRGKSVALASVRPKLRSLDRLQCEPPGLRPWSFTSRGETYSPNPSPKMASLYALSSRSSAFCASTVAPVRRVAVVSSAAQPASRAPAQRLRAHASRPAIHCCRIAYK
eukprot:206307-Chlamydomonas_euryale.AAC.3